MLSKNCQSWYKIHKNFEGIAKFRDSRFNSAKGIKSLNNLIKLMKEILISMQVNAYVSRS